MKLDEYLEYCKLWNGKIVIYGAGKIGKSVKKILEKNDIFPSAFVVTDKKNNKHKEDGLNVVEIDEYFNQNAIKNTLVLVAVKKPWNINIVKCLKEYDGLTYIDIIPDLIKLDIKPKLFEINAVVGCSIACKFCPQELLIKRYQGDKVLSFRNFQRVIKKIPKDCFIAFSGFSEPFLNPDMTKMIRLAAAEGYDIWLNSTLVGLTEKLFDEIKDVPISKFTLHLPDNNNYAHIPRTDEYYRVLRQVLEWTQIKYGKECHVVTKANGQGELPEDIKNLVEGKVLFHVELADRAGNLCDDSLHSVGVHKGRIICNYSPELNNFLMMPNGDIYLCCMDFGLRHYLGNIIAQSYSEICESGELKIIKEAMNSESGDCLCRHCTEARVLV